MNEHLLAFRNDLQAALDPLLEEVERRELPSYHRRNHVRELRHDGRKVKSNIHRPLVLAKSADDEVASRACKKLTSDLREHSQVRCDIVKIGGSVVGQRQLRDVVWAIKAEIEGHAMAL